MRRLFGFPGFLLLLTFLAAPATAQTTTPVRDPNAMALANRALQALAGNSALTDITLQASATYIAGSDTETGTATLVALGNQQSSMTLGLSGGQRQEIRRGVAGVWVEPDGVVHSMATHNCWTDANWFFPAFSLTALATDPSVSIVLAGQEVHDGLPVYHLSLTRTITGQTPDVTSLIQRLSLTDLYLSSTTLLPVALSFNTHADNDANSEIPIEIRFGNYQPINGVEIPGRIQMYRQNSLLLDLAVTKAIVNSGVPASAFTLPTTEAGGAQ